MPRTAAAVTAALALLAFGPASASCGKLGMEGTKCLTVTPRYTLNPGDPLPEGAELLLNPRYFGLPAVDGPWRYYRIGRSVYRVDSQSMTLIERVDGVNSNLF